jgi:hypothetical protein
MLCPNFIRQYTSKFRTESVGNFLRETCRKPMSEGVLHSAPELDVLSILGGNIESIDKFTNFDNQRLYELSVAGMTELGFDTVQTSRSRRLLTSRHF